MKSAKLRNPDAVGIAVLCRFEIQDTRYKIRNNLKKQSQFIKTQDNRHKTQESEFEKTKPMLK